jgi:hypothetical protein
VTLIKPLTACVALQGILRTNMWGRSIVYSSMNAKRSSPVSAARTNPALGYHRLLKS